VAEVERLRRDKERRDLKLSNQRSHNAKLIEVLEDQAGAWFRATMLRRYVRAPRRATGEGRFQSILGDQKVDFLVWAEQYVNQLDPLHPAPRVPELMPGPTWSFRSDSATQEQIARLLGRHWPQTYKVPAS